MQAPVCLITGANSGIGKATAHGLAQRDFSAVMVYRDTGRSEGARTEIIAKRGNINVDLLIADLASQVSARALATTIIKNYPNLDVIINNAGQDQRREPFSSKKLYI